MTPESRRQQAVEFSTINYKWATERKRNEMLQLQAKREQERKILQQNYRGLNEANVEASRVVQTNRKHLEAEWKKAAEEKLVHDYEDRPWLLEYKRRVLKYGILD